MKAKDEAGFFLALHLLDQLGVDYDREELLARLEEVAAGELSLFNGPEEELASLERRLGMPLPEHEREAFLAEFRCRRELDQHLRDLAEGVLDAGRRYGFS